MKRKWIVTTGEDRPIREVARDLEKAGLDRTEILEEIGTIVGEADDGALKRLRRVPGVADVSPEGTIDIGPPGSDPTW